MIDYIIEEATKQVPRKRKGGRPASKYDEIIKALDHHGKDKAVVLEYTDDERLKLYCQLQRVNRYREESNHLTVIRTGDATMALMYKSAIAEHIPRPAKSLSYVVSEVKEIVARVTERYGKLEYDSIN